MITPAQQAAVPVVPQRAVNSGTKQQVVWTLFASAVAGLSTYYYTFTNTATSLTSLPSAYALCTNGSRIYTVEESAPRVDCIVVDKQTISATGTLGIPDFSDFMTRSLADRPCGSGGSILLG